MRACRRRLGVTALGCACLWLGLSRALAQAPSREFESGTRLVEYVERCAESRPRDGDAELGPALVRDVLAELVLEPEHLRDGVRVLLELAALEPLSADADLDAGRARQNGRQADPREQQLAQFRAASARLGRDALLELLGPEPRAADRRVLELLTRECVAGESWPHTQRRIAIDLLAPRGEPAVSLCLMVAGRGRSDSLRAAALAALSGRREAAVDRYFLAECERGEPRCESALRAESCAHWRARRGQLGATEQLRLARLARRDLESDDWKRALFGAAGAAALALEHGAPLLIDALAAWQAREVAGTGSRRVEAGLVDALELLSGRKIGYRLEWWRSWWEVRQKRGDRAEDPAWNDTRAAPRQGGTAQFFGLELYSDRVTFVLDRSGSMAADFGEPGQTRYSEALAQLRACLKQLGKHARFNVVVFHSSAAAWRTKLAPATEREQREALQWLEGQGPGGATDLQAGLDLLQPHAESGEALWRELETDTVVVLCDGQAQRPTSMAQWLAQNNATGLLRVHCVQIGRDGNGQLEELAKATGGTFRLVEATPSK
jgi:Mg-chelatase subunit ChlD